MDNLLGGLLGGDGGGARGGTLAKPSKLADKNNPRPSLPPVVAVAFDQVFLTRKPLFLLSRRIGPPPLDPPTFLVLSQPKSGWWSVREVSVSLRAMALAVALPVVPRLRLSLLVSVLVPMLRDVVHLSPLLNLARDVFGWVTGRMNVVT